MRWVAPRLPSSSVATTIAGRGFSSFSSAESILFQCHAAPLVTNNQALCLVFRLLCGTYEKYNNSFMLEASSILTKIPVVENRPKGTTARTTEHPCSWVPQGHEPRRCNFFVIRFLLEDSTLVPVLRMHLKFCVQPGLQRLQSTARSCKNPAQVTSCTPCLYPF